MIALRRSGNETAIYVRLPDLEAVLVELRPILDRGVNENRPLDAVVSELCR
jgi:hypothetical protein